jgi:hypothetical protein
MYGTRQMPLFMSGKLIFAASQHIFTSPTTSILLFFADFHASNKRYQITFTSPTLNATTPK